MGKRVLLIFCMGAAVLGTAAAAHAANIWGVDPSNPDTPLVNLDPFTGTEITRYSVPGGLASTDTEIGLAGWKDALFYVNDKENGKIYTIDPDDGAVLGDYTVSGGWEIDGLGYYAGASGAWIYSSGCNVDDVHRYVAADGSSPDFFWSNVDDPRAMAGDNGGKIITYGTVLGGTYGIYMINPLSDTNATYLFASPSTSIVGMAFDGLYLYLSDTSDMLYTMSLGGTLVNSLDLGYTLYALGSSEGTGGVIPEPSTFAVWSLLIGSVAVVGWRRRKR